MFLCADRYNRGRFVAETKSGGGGCLTVIALCLVVAWCHNREPAASPLTVAPALAASDGAAVTHDDEGGTGDETIGYDDETKGGETYAEYDTRRDQLATGLYSGDDECTTDFSGHDAGREWAERRGITSPDDCGGQSWSFEEGCRSYAQEQQPSGEEAEDGGGE